MMNKFPIRTVKAAQALDRHARVVAVGSGRRTVEAPKAAAEVTEGRSKPEGNLLESTTAGTPSPGSVSSGLQRIRATAQAKKGERFTALLHHLSVEMLGDAYRHVHRQAAVGVDAITWSSYRDELRANIVDLHTRVHTGRYRAQPARRVWIPKADGQQRPLGVAALEDKIVQQGIAWMVNAMYETDFAGFSYGFRPGRSQRHALDALWIGLTRTPVNWVVDADIQGFFDALDHQCLMRFLAKRINDPRILRLIQKWLRAGVCEKGQWSETMQGTPQGSVISPLLANIYLHDVLDYWIKDCRKQEDIGNVIIVRYADDFVVGFQRQEDAVRFMAALRMQMQVYNLRLHPEKTRLIECGRFAASHRERRDQEKVETFDFLGFTHIWRKRRSDGGFTVWRHSISKRLSAKVAAKMGTRRLNLEKRLSCFRRHCAP